MRSTLTVALLAVAAAALGGSHHRWDGHISCGKCVTPIVEDVTDCSDLRVIINDRDAVRAEEIVPVGDVRSLTVRAPEAGGIYVRRSDSPRFSVKACKAAEIDESLSDVQARVTGERVSATGPSSHEWLIYFIVEMPRGAHADFGTTNGPISIRGADGTIVAHAENGPVGAKETTGSIRLTAENGPVAFSGSSGDVVLRTDNGPIAVDLRDSYWEHGSLSARTDNGPLALTLPRGYRSGVTIETDGHSPVQCRTEQCREQRRVSFDNDDSRWPSHIDLGSGAVSVTLTTHNGPVAIEER